MGVEIRCYASLKLAERLIQHQGTAAFPSKTILEPPPLLKDSFGPKHPPRASKSKDSHGSSVDLAPCVLDYRATWPSRSPRVCHRSAAKPAMGPSFPECPRPFPLKESNLSPNHSWSFVSEKASRKLSIGRDTENKKPT